MGNTWHADIEHFLQVDGLPSPDLPRPAKMLLDYFGSIIEAVTAVEGDGIVATTVCCRRRPGRRRCEGRVIARIDGEDRAVIRWECPLCADRGFLYGWRGTMWDLSARHQGEAGRRPEESA